MRPELALRAEVVAHQSAIEDDNVRPVDRFHLKMVRGGAEV